MYRENEPQKMKLLKEIEQLISYGEKAPTIDPKLLAYLSLNELETIKASLLERTSHISEEDSLWLEQFKRYT